MKRSRSYIEHQDQMGASELRQRSRGGTAALSASVSLPQASPSLASSEARASSDHQKRAAVSERVRGCPSESACSRGSWPTEQTGEPDGKSTRPALDWKKDRELSRDKSEHPEQMVIVRVANSDRIKLKDVACEPIDAIAERMREQPDELLEDLKAELRDILSGTGGPQQREEFIMLQNFLLGRTDLSTELLMAANKAQLEILVAIKTGIQAFLHPDISVTQSLLTEVFFYKRCRNIACQNKLPVEDCKCEVCNPKAGFCNACMCTICSKFDFDVNTCRWIGCDFCSHWTHTDCAIRVGQISTGPALRRRAWEATEMLFRCRACKQTSELVGWVKDVFGTCAANWEREELMKEFDSVRRIFHGSQDSRGKRLFWKSEELLHRLESGADGAGRAVVVCQEMQHFLQELEAEVDTDIEGKKLQMIEPQEACSRIAEVVQEAVAKIEAVAEEKVRALKKARLALESCDTELEDKKRELEELQFERQQKKQEIEELEIIVRLKKAEADMFQTRADEARQKAESLQQLVAAKSESIEEDYTSRYLKLRLNEAEVERRYLFERIQLQEHCRPQPDPSQMLMYNIQDLLKQVHTKNDTPGQTEDSGPPS